MTSLWDVESPFTAEPLGGRASFGQIFDSARDQVEFAHSSNMAVSALEQAYDNRIDQVKRATGETLTNPFRAGVMETLSPNVAEAHLPQTEAQFATDLASLAEKHPGIDLGLDRPVHEDAQKIMAAADPAFDEKFSSSDGFGRWLAAFAGGAVGALRDPLQAPLMLLGGVEGTTAKTAIGRIAQMGLREGAINAAATAVSEPSIQIQRARAGLPSGVGQGAADILYSGVIGAGLGLGGQTFGEAAARVFRRAPLAEASSAAATALDETIREGFAGRMAIGDRALRMMDDDIGAAVQSTLAKARAQRGVDRASEEALAFGAGDPARVQRIAENFLIPEEAAPKPPQSLVDFLIAKGGVRDYQGEMAALGLDAVSQKFRGRLVKPKGMELDRARELAAEAGYLGSPEQGAKTSVPDLLNALDEEHRHGPVYSLYDQDAAHARSQADAVAQENSRVRDVVGQVEAAADKNLPDDVILRAAQAAVRDGIEPLDALERTIMEDFRAGPAELISAPKPGTVRFYHGGTDPASGGGRFVSPDPVYARNFRSAGTPNEVHYVDIPKNDPIALAARDQTVTTEERYMNVELPEKWAKRLKPLESLPKEPAHPYDIFTPPDLPESASISDEQLAAMAADQAHLEHLEIPVGASIGEEGNDVHMRTLADLLEEAKRDDGLAALIMACRPEEA